MRSLVCLLAIAGLLMVSCRKSGGCAPEKYVYAYLGNRQIDTTRVMTGDPFEYYNYTISAGTANVFKWNYFFADCPEIADDEGSRNIYFEAPAGIDHFIITDSAQLRAAKCLIFLSCECYPSLPLMIRSGTIEGTREAKGWKIRFDINLPWQNGGRITTEQLFEEEK